MSTTIRHFDSNQGLDTYTDGELLVERDDFVVRVDAVVGDEDAPFGRPGTSLEMPPEDASILAVKLLAVTGLTGYPCGSGDRCSTKRLGGGFFNIAPLAGWHEAIDDAIDCVRQAAR